MIHILNRAVHSALRGLCSKAAGALLVREAGGRMTDLITGELAP